MFTMSAKTTHTHTHTRLTALCPGLPGWAGTRKVKPIWILLKQETVSGSSISWAVCKSAPRSRQITTPAPHHSVFYRPDALPAAQPTASKHWRHTVVNKKISAAQQILNKSKEWSVSISWQYLRQSTFQQRRPWLVYHTERPPVSTTWCSWGSSSHGSICDSWYDTIHTYIQIYIAPKIMRTNLSRWTGWLDGKGRLEEMEF